MTPSQDSSLETSSTNSTTDQDKAAIGPNISHTLCDLHIQASPPPAYSSTSQGIQGNSSSSRASLERAKPRRTIGNYTLTSTIGSGSMGKVRLAVHNLTGDKLAVKIVPRRQKENGKSAKKKDEHREVRTIREASIMLLLHHPFIASLKEMLILDPYYYLFMEYVNGGQLLDYIISHGKLKEKQARRFARQIISALDYCHRNSIVHRDLKIENILISQSGNIKIIDFGLSNLFSPRSSLNTFCGSLYFAAPELLNAKAYTGPEVDVWSFGVVLYVLVCGKVPFDDQNMPALHEKIKRGVVDYPTHLSTDCKSVLSRTLVTNPAHRASVSEITVHPWMTKGYDGPIDNYLPERLPLTLPVDMEIVRGMAGFEFGSETEIRERLEHIITSEEYQKAAKTLAERTAETHRNHRQGYHNARLSPSLISKKSFILPNEDPQSIPAAYHPLVSVYYLVKERMEREKRLARKEANAVYNDMFNTSSEHTHPTVVDDSVFGDPDVYHDIHRTLSAGIAYGKKGKSNVRMDEEGYVIGTLNGEKVHHGLNRLFSRTSPHRRKSIQSNHSSGAEEEADMHRSPDRNSSNNVFRRLSLALGRTSSEHHSPRSRKSSGTEATNVSSSTSTPIQIPSRDRNHYTHVSKSYAPPSEFHPATSPAKQGIQQSDVEIATAAAAAAVAANNNLNTFGNKISKILPRRMTLGQSSLNAENHSKFLNAIQQGNHQHTVNSFGGKTQHEVENNQQHDHEQIYPSTVDGTNVSQQKGTADENIKPVFLKGLFSVTTTSTKHPAVIRADLIRVLERIGVKWRESKGRFECVHMPSIDLNKVTIGEEDTDQSLSTEAVVPLPDLVVRFEIYIVKVPWLLGMHGLQFRRLGGDPWQYKNMCSKILLELKL